MRQTRREPIAKNGQKETNVRPPSEAAPIKGALETLFLLLLRVEGKSSEKRKYNKARRTLAPADLVLREEI